MSEKLDLAAAYYKVAAHQKYCAQQALDVAARLNEIADQLCEENMRDSKADTGT